MSVISVAETEVGFIFNGSMVSHMEYEERSRTNSIQRHLEAALAEADTKQKNRHIRESLQLLERAEPTDE